MTRLFRVKNTSSSWFCLARNEEDAINISWRFGKARAKKNLKIVNDQTDQILGSKDELNLNELLKGRERGLVAMRIPNLTFAEVLRGAKHEKKIKWVIETPY